MSRFVEGEDRRQPTLLPSCLDDYVGEENPARVIDVFVDELDLGALGFEVTPAATGRPAYHPATLLKLYVYGYLNRVPSSRRLEREAGRNVELMWLTGKLAPDHKTIANFRKDHGPAIQAACAHFVVLCRQIGLFTQALAAVDGSKFKAVNTRDKNFTATKLKKRMEQVAEHIAGYLRDLDTADRQEGEAAEARSGRLKDKIERAARADAGAAGDGGTGRGLAGRPGLADRSGRSLHGHQRPRQRDRRLQRPVRRRGRAPPDRRPRRGHDRQRPRAARGHEPRRPRTPWAWNSLDVLADRGYFSGEEIRRLRGPRRDALSAQAADLGRQGRRPLRQAGLRLSARPGRLSLPGRRAAAAPHDHRRAGPDAAPLLGPRQLPGLRPQASVHAQRRAARHPLGARGGHRRHAAADGPGARAPCACEGGSSNTPSARSKPGWARPTS